MSFPINVEIRFRYMAISDERQRVMPTSSDRKNGRELDYPEAVQLTNPSNASLLGEVDDKYQYSCDNKDNRVHGWISNCPAVGFWMITPSDEFRVGGPFKQDLTSHCGPTVLSMFVSTHYAGTGMVMHFKEGEPWKKVFGPVFIYLNSDSVEENRQGLWQDAKEQMRKETASWPYTFPLSPDFSHSNQRGCIRGQLFFYDRYNSIHPIPAMFAYVGLALPGEIGSWQKENKGYQFWTRADSEGNFFIENIRVGRYNLFAWVPGVIGDYKYFELITITPGCAIELYDLVYNPPRKGATLWEIGVPDRTAAEFFIPEPEPGLGNHLYADFDNYRFRQYGLWKRYTELYPWKDLIYTIGDSNYKRDWFFAHVTRYTGNYSYKATTWQIKFQLNNVCKTRNYTLRLALASANRAELQVRVNNEAAKRPLFTTGSIGKDNAIARHGIHGFYYMYEVGIPGKELVNGNNTIFLKQSKASGLFNGVMYDYIRLEEP
ncbi:Rhamnogalacturonan endolyase, partial [Bertholletia excelsa]